MPLAQLDRASDYGSEGREFESSAARQEKDVLWTSFFAKEWKMKQKEQWMMEETGAEDATGRLATPMIFTDGVDVKIVGLEE